MLKNIITKAGYLRIKDELNYLKNVKRKEIAESIKESRDYGDIAENSEYEEAKNEQAFLAARIQKLEYLLQNSEVIANNSSGTICPGSQVVLQASGEYVEYTLVGQAESDPTAGLISIDSPLGQAIIGKSKGEKALVDTISGPMEYKIVKIK